MECIAGKLTRVNSGHTQPFGGFTLLEVVIAVAVLSFGFLGVAGLMVSTIHANQTSRNMAIATNLAGEKMEHIRQTAYFGLDAAGTSSTEPYDTIPDYPSFARTVTISSTGKPGVKQVAVSVTWKHRHTRGVELTTLMSR